MSHAVPSRQEQTSIAVKGFILLLIITVLEVAVALIGNGHLISGLHFPKMVMIPVMIIMSLYKAYYIINEFMHLGHEVRSLAASILLPMLLLVWGVIAFLWEGEAWKHNRDYVKDPKNQPAVKSQPKQTSMIVPVTGMQQITLS